MVFSSHYTICGNSIIPNVAILLYRMWIVRRLFEEGKWLLSLGNARPTNLRMKSRHLIGKLHAASRAGYSVCLHRPTQGWTVGEYILLCKVSRLHPPSSLGLDGEGKPQPHHDDQQEVQKEPSSTYIPIGICWSFMKVERRHFVFQAPDRHYIHTILTPYGILCRASKYHKK